MKFVINEEKILIFAQYKEIIGLMVSKGNSGDVV